MTILTIAKNTLGDAMRKKILNIFLLVALALIVFSFSFMNFSMREELTIIKSFGLGMIAMVGMLIVVVLGINLVPNEIERRTIYTILSKPVRRYEFLLGKFFGALATLFINLALMGIVFVVMVAAKNHWHPEFDLLKGVMMLFFQLFLLSATAMVFSVWTTPIVNFFLTTAVYIVGNLSEVTLSMVQTEKNLLVKGFYWVIHYMVPNFANFNTQNPLIHPTSVIKNEWLYYSQNIVYAVVYSSMLLIIAILVFERRDM
jgi:ABC-type transport system involved in multi-copper enzyme maturation permease subunit